MLQVLIWTLSVLSLVWAFVSVIGYRNFERIVTKLAAWIAVVWKAYVRAIGWAVDSLRPVTLAEARRMNEPQLTTEQQTQELAVTAAVENDLVSLSHLIDLAEQRAVLEPPTGWRKA